jgi:hypothetical protein
MKKLALFALLIIIVIMPGFSDDKISENFQRIVPIDSEIYSLIDYITMESGASLLSSIRPCSAAEVFNILGGIDYSVLSDAGKSAFDQILTLMEKQPVFNEDNVAMQVGVKLAAELYLHTSADESIWNYGYEERLPVFTLPVEAWFNESFYACLENSIEESRFKITDVDSDGNYIGNLTNIPVTFGDINYHFPQRAFISTGGDNWNLQIGREQLEYGMGESGKLLLSSYADYYDMMKLKGFSDNFAFTWTYINLESWKDTITSDGVQRAFVDHAIETRVFDILTLYLNESIVLYGEDPELQFINPLLIYHNLFIKQNANSIASAGFRLTPIPGISLYGELAVDQLQTGLEQALYGSGVTATPNADAHMLGLKGALPLGPGYLGGFFEYIYTSPWMYLRDGPSEVSYYWQHRELSDVLKAIVFVTKPLGFKYGPDTIAFAVSAGYTVPGVFSAALTADYVIKGENTIETAYTDGIAAAEMTTPTGTPENKLVIGLSGTYKLFSFLSAQADLAWIYIDNYEHVTSSSVIDFQSALSLIFSL